MIEIKGNKLPVYEETRNLCPPPQLIEVFN